MMGSPMRVGCGHASKVHTQLTVELIFVGFEAVLLVADS